MTASAFSGFQPVRPARVVVSEYRQRMAAEFTRRLQELPHGKRLSLKIIPPERFEVHERLFLYEDGRTVLAFELRPCSEISGFIAGGTPLFGQQVLACLKEALAAVGGGLGYPAAQALGIMADRWDHQEGEARFRAARQAFAGLHAALQVTDTETVLALLREATTSLEQGRTPGGDAPLSDDHLRKFWMLR